MGNPKLTIPPTNDSPLPLVNVDPLGYLIQHAGGCIEVGGPLGIVAGTFLRHKYTCKYLGSCFCNQPEFWYDPTCRGTNCKLQHYCHAGWPKLNRG